MSALLLIFVSMLLAWNAIPQPEWCKSFWDWVSTVWSKRSVEKCEETKGDPTEKCKETS